MNIFVTDKCPKKSAQNLDNKRVIKMILESAQLLSTAAIYSTNPDLFKDNSKESVYLRTSLAKELELYKPTHINHPCSIWVRQSKSNYLWLFNHLTYLLMEYTVRFNKVHKVQGMLYNLSLHADRLPNRQLTKFVNCAANSEYNISFKHLRNTIKAYRQYLSLRWTKDKRIPSWGVRKEPNFLAFQLQLTINEEQLKCN